MSLIEDVANVYRESKGAGKGMSSYDNERLISNQIESIVGRLKVRAGAGVNEIRLMSDVVHPETAKRLKKEGFTVLRDDVSTVVKIPLQHN